MSFEPDRRFDSVTQAFKFLFGEFVSQGPVPAWVEEKSGLTVPRPTPRHLFRGECGDFESTLPSISRPGSFSSLAPRDREDLRQLMHALRWRFAQDDYRQGDFEARGFLQHYGLPTRFVDFTGNLGHAFTFAACDLKTVGRVCVFPMQARTRALAVSNFVWHDWAERARRQDAFALATLPQHVDLKSERARAELGLLWFEFPITISDTEFFKPKYDGLLRTGDDPAAGFLRHEITEYVEAKGKFSAALTAFLLKRIPLDPRCYRVQSYEREAVVVNHEPSNSVGVVDSATEQYWSQRYWSQEFPDSSWDRMLNWSPPSIGSVFADPRTLHSTS